MKQQTKFLNLFCKKNLSRALLLLILLTLSYTAIRQNYNLAHWVPRCSLRAIGIPYHTLLWFEQHMDAFLHFLGAAILVFFIFASKLPGIANYSSHRQASIAFILVVILCIFAEIAQFIVGRGTETLDLLLGILGGFMAYFAIDKDN